ncbi:MAG: cation transporter [Candidatus Eremiobacteraeota bacterium]|nr:cation transporter [Candidatus Eremiobacteraeota bacterium]
MTGVVRARAPAGGDAIAPSDARTRLARRGRWLSVATIGYNSLEGLLAVGAGVAAGSVALVGFGVDSIIEVTAALAALWRLRAERFTDPERRERAEQVTLRIIGVSFLALAAYIAIDALVALWRHEAPETSRVGLVLTALSIVVMPALARAKRGVAAALASGALAAEAAQTQLCAYLSAIVLGGLALNVLFGWWWADPMAALVIVPIIAKEGIEGLRGETSCTDGCHT